MEIKKTGRPKNIPGISLGINIAVGMALFTILGNWIDQKLGDEHFWILIGMFVGLFYCGYEIWKLISQSSNSQDDSSNNKMISNGKG